MHYLEQLQDVEQRLEELHQRLMEPSVTTNPALYRDLMKELKTLTPLVETYRRYRAAVTAADEAKELLAEADDAELRALAQEEFADNQQLAQTLAEELKVMLLPKDPNDDKSVIMELRAGAGGEEAALFAHSLFRMYSMYAEDHGWKLELLSANETELGGMKEVTFSVEGEAVYSRMKFESGVHRVQRVPETESQGRVQTSTVTVAVLPEVDDVEIDINPTDLKIDTYRSSGAGGQHINKTESAIRITHLPTGMVVECQDERSQLKNKEKAMKVLRSRLYEEECRKQHAAVAADRKAQVGTGDRSERIRTYNFPQGRLTDHRIGLTLYRLLAVMDGDLDEIIDALVLADQTAKLAAAEQGE